MKFDIEFDMLLPKRRDSKLNATFGGSRCCSISLPLEIAGQRPRNPGRGGGGAEDAETEMTNPEDAPRPAQREAQIDCDRRRQDNRIREKTQRMMAEAKIAERLVASVLRCKE